MERALASSGRWAGRIFMVLGLAAGWSGRLKAQEIRAVAVQFRLGDTNLGAEDTTAPFGITWDTTTVANGSYSLTAIARNASGQTVTSAPVTVTVQNASTAPTVRSDRDSVVEARRR